MPQKPQLEHDAERARAQVIVGCSHSGFELLKQKLGFTSRTGTFGSRASASSSEPITDSHVSSNGKDTFLYQYDLCRYEGQGNAAAVFKKWMAENSLSFEANLQAIVFVRDPVRVFDTWKHTAGEAARICVLVDCHMTLFGLMGSNQLENGRICCYERLTRDPWEEARGDLLYEEGDEAYHGLVSNGEKYAIESALGLSYLMNCWEEQINTIRPVLLEKTWFAFDLDDTLHEFRRASGKATTAVLEVISALHGISRTALKDRYCVILRQKTANAFADGKTSLDYRKERFTSLLAHFALPQPDTSEIKEYLDLYEKTLMEALELKCGALSLLKQVHEMGKKVAIITEGPQDAQERTVEALGIKGYVDFLATTNRFGVSKTDGMLSKVLHHLQIASRDVAYIGDSYERDVVPARAEDVFVIHLDESRSICLDKSGPRINTLHKLELMLTMKTSTCRGTASN